MAKIRKLKYEGQIVKQPIHDGKRLSKWIHDGVVVWQNSFADIWIVQAGQQLYYWDLKNNEILGVMATNYARTGVTQDYVWSSRHGKQFRIAFEPQDGSGIEIKKESSVSEVETIVMTSNQNRFLTYYRGVSNNDVYMLLYKVEVDEDAKTFVETEIGNLEDILGISIPTIETYGVNELGLYIPTDIGLFVGRKTINNINYVYIITANTEGEARIIHTYQFERDYPNYGDTFNSTNLKYRANNKNYMFGRRDHTYKVGSTFAQDVSMVVIKEEDGIVSVEHSDFFNSFYKIHGIQDVRYDIENERYLLYQYMYYSNETSHIYVVDENMQYISEVELPDYLDVPIKYKTSSYSKYTHFRIYFNEAGKISQDGYLLINGFEWIIKCTYFDENGEPVDNQTLEIMCRNVSNQFGMVYIDNLYCLESENNYGVIDNLV